MVTNLHALFAFKPRGAHEGSSATFQKVVSTGGSRRAGRARQTHRTFRALPTNAHVALGSTYTRRTSLTLQASKENQDASCKQTFNPLSPLIPGGPTSLQLAPACAPGPGGPGLPGGPMAPRLPLAPSMPTPMLPLGPWGPGVPLIPYNTLYQSLMISCIQVITLNVHVTHNLINPGCMKKQ